MRFVIHGHGVHNLNYAVALLNVAIENSRQIIDLAGDAAAGDVATLDSPDPLP